MPFFLSENEIGRPKLRGNLMSSCALTLILFSAVPLAGPQ